MSALLTAGTDQSVLLSYADGTYRAWGGYEGYDINILDTALALDALVSVGYDDWDNTLQYTLGYLAAAQNSDGGWGFYAGDESNTYITALTIAAMKRYASTNTTVATAVNKARDYLISHQNTDGGFGSSPSTAYETVENGLCPLNTPVLSDKIVI
jgi:prenyltransferase beta subunit